jgi:hypothetical protein
MGILNDFYFGNIGYPWERKTKTRTDKQKVLTEKISEAEKDFTDKMTEEDREKFAELKKLYNELDGINEADLFTYSFTMGFMWAADVARQAEEICENEAE